MIQGNRYLSLAFYETIDGIEYFDSSYFSLKTARPDVAGESLIFTALSISLMLLPSAKNFQLSKI